MLSIVLGFFYSIFFFSELGSNPLKSAGIDDGAFADLKRVSYIRVADTSITEIPKGMALISISTSYSHIGEFELILVLSSRAEPNATIKWIHAWIEFYSETMTSVWKEIIFLPSNSELAQGGNICVFSKMMY